MGATKELFIKMNEEEYAQIPREITERHLASKVVKIEDADFEELMEDATFRTLYQEHKRLGNQLNERKYQLRELKRTKKLKEFLNKQNGK